MTEKRTIDQIRGQHLHVPPTHHRSRWGDMAALKQSISENGINVPLSVVRRKEGGYWIDAGVRRFTAGVEAGFKTFPCLVEERSQIDSISWGFRENREREAPHPMDEAEYCNDLAKLGMDHAAIAKQLGIKKRDVTRRLQLIALSAKARKAFVEGRVDEDGALALATTDHAKQADVVAALAAGSLQREEVVGYVRRTFTAQLDDVPWRASDEKLLPKAGACTTCPKRSDRQRDLFGEDTAGVRCLDVDCWRSKMEAQWKRETERPDVQIYSEPVDATFVRDNDKRPVVLTSSGMVDADAACRFVVGRTWREAAFAGLTGDNDNTPTVYLARDQDGRPRALMREAVVTKLIRKTPEAKEQVAARVAADPTRPELTGPDPRAEGRIRRKLIQRLAELVVAGGGNPASWIAARVIEGATARAVSAAAEILAGHMTALDQLEQTHGEAPAPTGKPGLLALANASEVLSQKVAATVLIFETADAVNEINTPIKVLAGLCGIDLDALEAEIRGKA